MAHLLTPWTHRSCVRVTDPRRIEVNITMPRYITEKEWGLAGTLYAE